MPTHNPAAEPQKGTFLHMPKCYLKTNVNYKIPYHLHVSTG